MKTRLEFLKTLPGREKALLGVTVAYLAISTYFAWGSSREFLLYIAVILAGVPVIAEIHRRVVLPFGILVCLSGWGLVHMAGGLVPVGDSVLYNLWFIPGWFRYDHAVHAFGFGACAWIGWHCLCDDLRQWGMNYMGVLAPGSSTPTLGRLIRVGMFAEGCGAANELVEGLAVWSFPEANTGGFDNLIGDLIYNTVGIALVLAVIRWRMK